MNIIPIYVACEELKKSTLSFKWIAISALVGFAIAGAFCSWLQWGNL